MSGVPQYLRKASLKIGDADEAIDVSDLRFRFYIRRGDIQTPNTADIRVYNLSPATAKKISAEFTRVVFQAGYAGNFGTIFDGTIIQARRGRENPTDTYLDITAADGDQAYNYSVTALSLAAGQTSPKTQVEMIVRDMANHGVSKGYIPESLSSQPLPRGKVIYGMSRDAMRKVAQNADVAWSIQDGQIDVVPLTSYKPSSEVPVITAATGMIGMPEQTANGIRVKVLLNPMMKIGQLIKIDNKSILQQRYSLSVGQQVQNGNDALASKLNDDGLYYVMRVDHSGDTRGDQWYSDMICLAVDATMIPKSQALSYPAGQKYVDETKAYIDKINKTPNVIKRNP